MGSVAALIALINQLLNIALKKSKGEEIASELLQFGQEVVGAIEAEQGAPLDLNTLKPIQPV